MEGESGRQTGRTRRTGDTLANPGPKVSRVRVRRDNVAASECALWGHMFYMEAVAGVGGWPEFTRRCCAAGKLGK